eukprot:TRINITY_DN203_c0_g2_i1.p1 TRINITY_DN203_c0_g2~~TRINITY_DN203_c0_g2_i1.p1  ORF type:complete len:244 (-),score=39.58 TRINITY_DN203_c0_g2_i1:324-1055(-)
MNVTQYDIESLKQTNVSTFLPEVKRHVVRVYGSLALTTIFSVLGVAWSVLALSASRIAFAPLLGFIFALSCLLYISFSSEVTENTVQSTSDKITKLFVLLAFGFFEGVTISQLVHVTLMIDPSLVVTAFIGTLVVFSSLSASALLAKRKSYLYLYGFLSSATLTLFYMGIANLFLRIEFLQNVQIYGGLLVFSGYVLFDTQVMIEKVHRGSRDYVKHAAELFIDLVGLFVRILIILAKNKSRK